MNDTHVMWSDSTSSHFVLLPWIVSSLCLLISFKWISALVLSLVWLRTRKVSGNLEENDGSKLKRVYTQTLSTALEVQEEGVQNTRTYDEDWINSPHIFNLEQRAIFSKTWLFAIHRSRFTKPGDYHTLTLATFSIFLILGRDQKIRAFHNVCRHRAYTITKKASGSSAVLGCRYHGWSYNTRGELVKAPEFEGLPGFDKKLNGLFEIRTRVTREGCVFVNFDAGEEVQGFDEEEIGDMERWKTGNCGWISGWNVEGNFNWKIADIESDGPELEEETVDIASKLSSAFPLFRKRAYKKKLHLFPGTEFYLCPSGKTWISIRCIPQTTSRTKMQIDLYASLSKDHPSNKILESRLRAHFQERICQLEERQASFIRDGMHKGNLIKQDAIHSLLITHSKMERLNGREIHPAIRMQAFSETGQQDDDLCKELEGKTSKSLDSCLPNSSDFKKSFEW